jgi:hypothetical protein
VLLRQLQEEPLLDDISHVIIDEVHALTPPRSHPSLNTARGAGC